MHQTFSYTAHGGRMKAVTDLTVSTQGCLIYKQIVWNALHGYVRVHTHVIIRGIDNYDTITCDIARSLRIIKGNRCRFCRHCLKSMRCNNE